MQDLIEQLKSKAGLTDEQAAKAVQTVKEFIQSKLPPMMHGVIDNFMGDNKGDDWMDKAKHAAETSKEKVQEFSKEAGEKMGEWADKAGDAAKDAMNIFKNMVTPKDKEKGKE